MKINLEELAIEANSSVGIGKAWLAVIEQAVKTKCRKMPPRDFGYQEWNQDVFDDVVQDVVEKRLLNKGGIQYVLAEATSAAHAQAAIYRLVALGLDDLREPSVVNNIYENLKRRLEDRGFDLEVAPTASGYEPPINELSMEVRVKEILLAQPRYPNRGTHRESAIFSPKSFDLILDQLLDEKGPLTSQTLRNGVKKALTHLVRAENYIDDARDFMDGQIDNSDVEREATNQDQEFGARILKKLSPESEKVLVALSYGVKSDSELAAALGLKARQTAKKWHDDMKKELIELFEQFEIPAENQMDVVLSMRELLGVSEGSESIKEAKYE
jgi:hypothetical protein